MPSRPPATAYNGNRKGNGALAEARLHGGRRAPGIGARARALLREQLADALKPGALVEAAAQESGILTGPLLAADALGVRTRRGQWSLPG